MCNTCLLKYTRSPQIRSPQNPESPEIRTFFGSSNAMADRMQKLYSHHKPEPELAEAVNDPKSLLISYSCKHLRPWLYSPQLILSSVSSNYVCNYVWHINLYLQHHELPLFISCNLFHCLHQLTASWPTRKRTQYLPYINIVHFVLNRIY